MKKRIVFAPLLLVLAGGSAQAQLSPRASEDLLRRLETPADLPASVPNRLLEGSVDATQYRVGPGDLFRVRISGRVTFVYTPRVDPEGWLSLGDFGSVSLRGLTLDGAREAITAHLEGRLRNSRIDVRLQGIREFKIFVLGEVMQPGAHPATAMTRASEAIQLAGGVLDSASVRTIRILREGAAEPLTVDLVSFRLAGDTSGNPFLSDGDRIVVHPRAHTFRISGAVSHPGTWDLKPGDTLSGILAWNPLLPGADLDRASVARFRDASAPGTGGEFDTLTLSLTSVLANGATWPLEDGDRIYVRRHPRFLEAYSVTLQGEVVHPGEYPIRPGEDRVSDVLAMAGGLLPEALPERITLVRDAVSEESGFAGGLPTSPPLADLTLTERARIRLEISPDTERLSVDLEGGNDPVLDDGDRIVVPRDLGFVRVTGEVARPGLYARDAEWDLGEYLVAAGGVTKRGDRKQTRVFLGGEGAATEAGLGDIESGDVLFVPERIPRSAWQVMREVATVAAQVATVIIVIDQATK